MWFLPILTFLLVSPTKPAAPSLTSPVARQVFQRSDSNNKCAIKFVGNSVSSFAKVQAQATVVNGGTSLGWSDIVPSAGKGAFSGSLTVAPGQYSISVQVISQGKASPSTGISKVGCGDIFIGAGQSLMASWGQTASQPSDDRSVKALFNLSWAVANDPQQTTFFGSNGNGNGSIIPVFLDALIAHLNMPVGFLDAAVGNTSSADWVNTWYAANLLPAIRQLGNTGFRAVLWEQGNNDGTSGTTTPQYEINVAQLIASSRSDSTWTVPWGIARSTITATIAYSAIQTAQAWLATPANISGGATFAGSDTDSLSAGNRFDGTHLTQAGQTTQANQWEAAVVTYFAGQGIAGY